MATTTPNRLGKYEIRGILGRGAMGTVYDGFDPVIERRVAIKTVNKDSMEADEAVELLGRFKREAQAAGRLNHPGIVSIYDYGDTDDLAYIAMEFISGKELKNYFEREERFNLADVVRIMCDILDALDHAHRNGVVHRDIKPANIMITEEGRVKVADFGVARIESSMMTQVGTRIGTPAYMSPEQHQGLPVDGRSDIFSAGVILYQFLTCERPFSGGGYTIIQQILKQDPIPPSEINFSIPRALDLVVSKSLAKRAEDRFANAREFAEALQKNARGDADSLGLDVEMDGDGLAVASVPLPTAPGQAPAPTTPAGAGASIDSAANVALEVELEFWKEIKDSTNPDDFSDFIDSFPTGRFMPLAKRRLARFEAGSTAGRSDQEAERAGKRDDQTVVSPKPPRVVVAPSQETLNRLKREQEEKAKREAEEQAKREALEAARKEADERARKEAGEKRRREAEALARKEAEERRRREAAERGKREAEAQARRDAEDTARRAAEEKARLEEEAKAREEAKKNAIKEAEAKAKRDAEEKARREGEEKIRRAEEDRRRREAEAKAKQQEEEERRRRLKEGQRAQEKAKREADEEARKEAEEKGKREAEARARQEAEDKARRVQKEREQREVGERACRLDEEDATLLKPPGRAAYESRVPRPPSLDAREGATVPVSSVLQPQPAPALSRAPDAKVPRPPAPTTVPQPAAVVNAAEVPMAKASVETPAPAVKAPAAQPAPSATLPALGSRKLPVVAIAAGIAAMAIGIGIYLAIGSGSKQDRTATGSNSGGVRPSQSSFPQPGARPSSAESSGSSVSSSEQPSPVPTPGSDGGATVDPKAAPGVTPNLRDAKGGEKTGIEKKKDPDKKDQDKKERDQKDQEKKGRGKDEPDRQSTPPAAAAPAPIPSPPPVAPVLPVVPPAAPVPAQIEAPTVSAGAPAVVAGGPTVSPGTRSSPAEPPGPEPTPIAKVSPEDAYARGKALIASGNRRAGVRQIESAAKACHVEAALYLVSHYSRVEKDAERESTFEQIAIRCGGPAIKAIFDKRRKDQIRQPQ